MSSIVKVVGVAEGIISLFFYTILAYIKKEHEPQNLEQPKLNPGLKHEYLSLPNGNRLHYILPSHQPTSESISNLVIFIHGFPDSCHLWSHLLLTPLQKRARLVSLDLPGFGDSDGLSSYGPDDMLTTVYLAIEELKKVYGSKHCIVVGHDWGGIIASRLAAETVGVIDHLVLVNSTFPTHFAAMIQQRINKTGQLIFAGPGNTSYRSWLTSIKAEIGCVTAQLLKSHYIFMFQLSFFTTLRFPSVMRHLLSNCHRMAKSEYENDVAQRDAVTGFIDHYDPTSMTRWNDRVRLYREGLLSEPWNRTNSTTQSSNIDVNTIKCPTTVVFGLADQALDSRFAADDIQSFIQPVSSHYKGVVWLLKDVGHWSPLNSDCSHLIENIVTEQLQA